MSATDCPCCQPEPLEADADTIAGSAAEEAAQAAHVAEEQAGELERGELVAATVDGIAAQLGAAGLLALHGELVTLPGLVPGGFVGELLTALERAYVATPGHSVRS